METNNTFATDLGNPQAAILKTRESNGLGLAGFIMSLIGFVLCWVPILKWMLLLPAFILSLVGNKRSPSKLAAIGAIVSGLILIILILRKVLFWGSLMRIALL